MASPDNIANHYPENQIFWSSKKLINMLEDELFEEDSHASMLAELLVRWYFNPQSEVVSDYLSQKLPKESIDKYINWRLYASPFQKPSQLFLFPQNDEIDSPNRDFLKKVQIKALRRFENLLGSCDGIIPIISQEPDGNKCGCAIPFRLEPTNDSDSCVIDLDDKSIPEWSNSVSELISELELPQFRVRLLFHSSVERYLKYTGGSLQFPVLMAYWRLNEEIPNYNPFKVVATGIIQGKRLDSVRLEEKLNGLKDIFGTLVFLCPDSDNTDNREMVPIPVGTSVDDVLSIVNKQLVIRKNEIGLTCLGIKYYDNRIQELFKNIKKHSDSSLDFIIDNLQLFLDELDEDQYPEKYFQTLLALTFAYCHIGNYSETHKCISKAKEIVKRFKSLTGDLRYQCILLSIEEMVLSLHEENFERLLSLASEIKNQLEELDENNVDTYDLKMRYYGTLGQAYMFGVVCQIEGFNNDKDKDNAYEFIREAIKYATKFQDNSEEDNIDEVIRDMNYRHLWYALFDPDSQNEQKYYNVTVREISNKQLPGKTKDTNLNYLFRNRCFAAYRRILLSSDNENAAYSTETIPVQDNIESRLKGLIYKYQAAGLASLNKKADAKEMFDKSFNILTECNDVYLAMTVAAEAYRSFSVLGDAQTTAEQYRKKTLRLFEDNNDFEFFQTANSWKEFLKTPWDEFQASGKDFPGLHYYY